MALIRNLFSSRAERDERRVRRLAASGERAPAVVTRVESLARAEEGETTRVDVTYSIEPAESPAFEVTKKVTVTMPAVPVPGDPALAVYAPDDPVGDSVVLGGRPGDPASAYELEVALNRTVGLLDREPALAPDAQHSAIAPTRHRLPAVRGDRPGSD